MQESVESRVARNESDVSYVQSRLENVEIDLRYLRDWMGRRYDALEARFERKLEALEARLARKLRE